MKYLYEMPLDEPDFIFIDVKIFNGKLKKLQRIDVFVAAENTWQGIVYKNWPYNQIPLKVIGKIPDPGVDSSLIWI